MARIYALTFTLAAALSAGAIAQEGPGEAPQKDTQGVAASPLYQSAFAGYQGFREPVVMSWRAANDQVRDAGSMAGHDMSKMDGGATIPGHDMGKTNVAPAVTREDTGVQDATPAHDMSKMKSGAKAEIGMPGHDRSKMKAASAVSRGETGAQKTTPAHDMSQMKSGANPEMRMPGHDMSKMAPSQSAKKAGSAAAPSGMGPTTPTTMPGHGVAKMYKETPAGPSTPAPTASNPMADGEVQKVDKDTGKITIKHGPLANLDMPGMTMVFRVKDSAMLEQVKAGDKVKFNVEKLNGALTVMAIEAAK